MNPVTLRRIAIAGAILTVLVAIDGLYMTFANYHPDDTGNNGFGGVHPSDGQTVLIAALLLLVITVIAFVLSRQASMRPQTTDQAARQDVEPEVKA